MPKPKRSPRLAAVVLASGEDAFESQIPKELHPLLGAPLIGYGLDLCAGLGANPTVVVTTEQRREQALVSLGASPVLRVRGASHAALVAAGLEALGSKAREVLVLSGDQPLVETATLVALLEEKRSSGAALGFLSVLVADPDGQPCVERGATGEVLGLRRSGRAAPRPGSDPLRLGDEEAPPELDAGVWVCDRALLATVLAQAPRARRPDALLAALIEAARARGGVVAWAAPSPEALRVVSRLDLAWAARLLRQRINHAHLRAGVTLEDPFTTLIEPSVTLAPDVTLGAEVQLRGSTRVAAGAHIEPFAIVIDSEIEAGAQVRAFSHLEGALVRAGAVVGPYARLRPLADIGPGAHIGNFVEVKKAVVEAGAKANHLAYLGDARVGAKANIGAGTICCNYDGAAKHHTDIGRGVFIGSNSTLVAPIVIQDGAYVGAGSTLTQEVPADALALGRARQVNKPGLAVRIRERNLVRAKKS